MKEMNMDHALGYVGTFLADAEKIPVPDKLIQKRRDICNECDRVGQMKIVSPEFGAMEEGDKTCSVEWVTSEFDYCGECGCSIDDKVEDLTAFCPLYKWIYGYEEWEEYTLPFLQRLVEEEGPYPVKWHQENQERKRKLAEEKAALEQMEQKEE